jgi:hypothetical protein
MPRTDRSGALVADGPAGGTTWYLGTVPDGEMALRPTRARYRSLADHCPSG